jgi:probable rRNA maturation factor
MPVHLVVETPAPALSSRVVRARAMRMLRAIQMEKAELSIVITGDKQIHNLNKIYRGKDRPTDVLAFAMKEGEFGAVSPGLLGDVIVSLATASRQARARNVAPLDEVTMLIAHGILHLLGWDHDTDAKDRAMRKETEKLCAAAIGKPERPLGDRASSLAPRSPLKGGKRKRQT